MRQSNRRIFHLHIGHLRNQFRRKIFTYHDHGTGENGLFNERVPVGLNTFHCYKSTVFNHFSGIKNNCFHLFIHGTVHRYQINFIQYVLQIFH